MKRLFCLILLSIFLASCAKNQNIQVGDTTVVIQKEHYGKGKTFVHVHRNETTALAAARHVAKKDGGTVLTLVHPGGRNIVFHLNNTRYEFDPNRIFSDKGIKKTLSQYGPYSKAAHLEVKKLAQQLINLIPKGKVIAVHNNQEYSIKNYLAGGDAAQDAQALYINPKHYYRNFYVLTQKNDFLRLKKKGFNGVLQSPKATDDGSLSIFLARQSYLNVEAGYGELSAQIAMLRLA